MNFNSKFSEKGLSSSILKIERVKRRNAYHVEDRKLMGLLWDGTNDVGMKNAISINI